MKIYLVILTCLLLSNAFFAANIQAQTVYKGGNLVINADSDVPSNVATITTIDGNLILEGGLGPSLKFSFALLNEVQGDLTIHVDLVHFPQFPALKVLKGNLTISGLNEFFPSPNIRAIGSALRVLTRIGGDLTIRDNTILELPDFTALTSIGGNILIRKNRFLGGISGFGALTSIGGSVDISNNPALSYCCGLIPIVDNTLMPGGTTTISNNGGGCSNFTKITNICLHSIEIKQDSDVPADLSSLTKILGNLNISGDLSTFPDFSALKVVEGSISIYSLSHATLTTLDDIFPALDIIRGALVITGNNTSQVISGFNELDRVGGSIWLTNNSGLRSISGFAKLHTLSSLFIDGNRALETLSGFAELINLKGHFSLINNRKLTTVSGFEKLSRVGGELELGVTELFSSGNMSLTTLPSFSALTSVGEDLTIESNAALASTPPFPVLKRVGGDLKVNRNLAIKTISGFGSLTSIGGDANFHSNSALATVSDFGSLVSIGGALSFWLNGALADLPAFSSLTKVGGELRITRNDMLSSCCGIFPFVSGTLTLGGGTDIDKNAAGCNSVSDVKANCGSTRTLRALSTDLTATSAAGRVIFDVAANVPWAITNSDTWISSITPKTGSDNQTITIVYDENTDPVQRDAVLTLSATGVGATETMNINLTQAAAPPVSSTPSVARQLSANKTDIPVTADAGKAIFDVAANVPWEITNSDTWISSITPKTGSDNQTITIVYDENTDKMQRDAVLTLAATGVGATETMNINLTQAAAAPVPSTPSVARQLSANKTNIPVNADAGRAIFDVAANVPWEITNSDTWISSITPKTGSANQTITIVYDENTDKMQRVAALTLAATGVGATETMNINLTQAAAAPVSSTPSVARQLSANKTNIPVNADAGRVIFDVAANVPWAITNSDTWISSITPKTGSANQTITIVYDENTNNVQRDGGSYAFCDRCRSD